MSRSGLARRAGHNVQVALRVLLFPLAMLPLWSLRSRWRSWYHAWRRNILESAGWILIRRWRRRFRQDRFQEKLARMSAPPGSAD